MRWTRGVPRRRRASRNSIRACAAPAPAACSHPEVVIATATQTRKFNLNIGREVIIVEGRAHAVQQAKELSQSHRRPISVERQDGRVSMQFQNGGLQSYRMETGRS